MNAKPPTPDPDDTYVVRTDAGAGPRFIMGCQLTRHPCFHSAVGHRLWRRRRVGGRDAAPVYVDVRVAAAAR
jgi:hypothetical protein